MARIGSGRWLKVCMLIFVVALVSLVAGCGSGNNEPAFNITGNWDVFTTTDGTMGEQGPNLFIFNTSSSALSGTTPQGTFLTGSVNDLNVSFSFVGSDGSTNNYSGTVSSNGTTIAGTWNSTNGQKGTWNAIIISSTNASFPPSVNIAGSWNAFMTTDGIPGEQGPDVVTFTQSGNNIAGTEQDRQIIGAMMSSNITSIIFFLNDGTSNFAFTGIVSSDGNSMSGTWTNTSGKTGAWHTTRN